MWTGLWPPEGEAGAGQGQVIIDVKGCASTEMDPCKGLGASLKYSTKDPQPWGWEEAGVSRSAGRVPSLVSGGSASVPMGTQRLCGEFGLCSASLPLIHLVMPSSLKLRACSDLPAAKTNLFLTSFSCS